MPTIKINPEKPRMPRERLNPDYIEISPGVFIYKGGIKEKERPQIEDEE